MRGGSNLLDSIPLEPRSKSILSKTRLRAAVVDYPLLATGRHTADEPLLAPSCLRLLYAIDRSFRRRGTEAGCNRIPSTQIRDGARVSPRGMTAPTSVP